jgi:hypothetical protein
MNQRIQHRGYVIDEVPKKILTLYTVLDHVVTAGTPSRPSHRVEKSMSSGTVDNHYNFVNSFVYVNLCEDEESFLNVLKSYRKC